MGEAAGAGGNGRAKQDADIKALAGSGVPAVVAAAAPGRLLIGEVDGAVRGTAACGSHGVGVCGAVVGEKWSLPAKIVPVRADSRAAKSYMVWKDCACTWIASCILCSPTLNANSAFRMGHPIRKLTRSPRRCDMEMSAARAEWVSAPTLIKSTPVSA